MEKNKAYSSYHKPSCNDLKAKKARNEFKNQAKDYQFLGSNSSPYNEEG